MIVSNHMLAGATIALAVKNPWLALPLALLSHFALDALPHYGYERAGFTEWRKHKAAYIMVFIDALAIAYVLFIVLSGQYWMALLAAAVAASPDAVWAFRYLHYERHGKEPALNPLSRFHLFIQICERPWGLYVEVAFFAGLAVLLQGLL